MDRLDVMRLFVRIAETGSFSRAARAAGVGQPTASKQIALLEERLGARLLQRTSRRLNLTDEGQAYYEASVRLLGEVDAAKSAIGRGTVSPAGVIRVALSAGFGRMYVVPRLPEFFARYPDLAVDVNVSERHVNLIEDGLDVAIRIGFLADSTLLARRIGSMGVVTVGSPECLRQFGEPKIPADLERHKAVVFTYGGVPRSKAERTAGLMSRARPKPARAKPPELAPETTVDEAIAIIQRNFLRQFLGNMPALESGDAVKAVHQMRVAVRRLRSVLGLFNQVFPGNNFVALRAQEHRHRRASGLFRGGERDRRRRSARGW